MLGSKGLLRETNQTGDRSFCRSLRPVWQSHPRERAGTGAATARRERVGHVGSASARPACGVRRSRGPRGRSRSPTRCDGGLGTAGGDAVRSPGPGQGFGADSDVPCEARAGGRGERGEAGLALQPASRGRGSEVARAPRACAGLLDQKAREGALALGCADSGAGRGVRNNPPRASRGARSRLPLLRG